MVSELQVYDLFFSLERSKGSAKSSQTLVKQRWFEFDAFCTCKKKYWAQQAGYFQEDSNVYLFTAAICYSVGMSIQMCS